MRPTREHATNMGHSYMITSATWGRRSLFQRERWAKLFIDTLYHYRGSAYLLHEFVVMPDHIHVLLTPKTSLEKAVQFIKGGFSYRARKELGSSMEVWQKGFSDHRIRDAGDYLEHALYIRQNPVRKHLCEWAKDYPYSSASRGVALDPVPQGLKPAFPEDTDTARLEGAPFQGNFLGGAAEAARFQGRTPDDSAEAARFQGRTPDDSTEAARFQGRTPDDSTQAPPLQCPTSFRDEISGGRPVTRVNEIRPRKENKTA